MEYCGASETEIQLCLHNPRHADPEARWASWRRTRQTGVLCRNDIRIEEGSLASNDPTDNSIEPPVAGAKPADSGEEPTKPAPSPADEEEKISHIGRRRVP